MPAKAAAKAVAKAPLGFISVSLEEAAVQRLGEHIETGSVKTYADVLAFLETSRKSQELCCPVCLNAWTLPATAKCGHIFCDRCICAWESSCRKKKIPALCPCCRATVEIIARTPPPPPVVAAKKRSIAAPNAGKQNSSKTALSRLLRYGKHLCGLISIASFSYTMYSKRPWIHGWKTVDQTQETSGTSGWKTLPEPNQHSLPKVHELVRMYGKGSYGLLHKSIAVQAEGPHIDPNHLQLLPHRRGFPVTSYFPSGTILKINNPKTKNYRAIKGQWSQPIDVRQKQPDETSQWSYPNATVIDAHGFSLGFVVTLPANVVGIMDPDPALAYVVSYGEIAVVREDYATERMVHPHLNTSLREVLQMIDG